MSQADSPQQPAPDRPRPGRAAGRGAGAGAGRDWAPLVGALVVLLLVAIFVLQNGDDVKVEFLFAEGEIPLGAALLLSAVLGGLATLLLGFVRRTRSRFRRR